MRVPLLDLKPQLKSIETDLKAAVLRVIDSTTWILGPEVQEFEREVAAYLGAGHAIGVSSGSDALLASLMALGVGPKDLVLTTPYSFFATAGCISRLGASPVFVDIDPRTYNVSPQALREWFEQHPAEAGRVKALLPVHLFGQCADLDPILDLAEERGIPVVEDAAQAIGSRYASRSRGARMAGTFGVLGCFSFFPSKNLGGVGDGGLVVTDDAKLAEKVRQLRAHGGKAKYYHEVVGGNFRLDPIQAAVLRVKLPHLDAWVAARQQKAETYDRRLASVTPPHLASQRSHHAYHQYVIAARDRDGLQERLTKEGIGNAVYYPRCLHEQECFRDLGYKTGDFPVSEWAAKHTLALPIYPELTAEMQDFVIQQIDAYASGPAIPGRN